MTIAIVGILASIGVANVNQYRSMARDRVRKQALPQVLTALEAYYVDHNEYPANPRPVSACSRVPGTWGYHADCMNELLEFLPQGYFDSFPTYERCGYTSFHITWYNYAYFNFQQWVAVRLEEDQAGSWYSRTSH